MRNFDSVFSLKASCTRLNIDFDVPRVSSELGLFANQTHVSVCEASECDFPHKQSQLSDGATEKVLLAASYYN